MAALYGLSVGALREWMNGGGGGPPVGVGLGPIANGTDSALNSAPAIESIWDQAFHAGCPIGIPCKRIVDQNLLGLAAHGVNCMRHLEIKRNGKSNAGSTESNDIQ